MKLLITGGAGYIGSTIASAALDTGHNVVILDNLSEGKREFTQGRTFYEGDIADTNLLNRIFTDENIDAVIHCAALIVVPESVANPLGYYENNVSKTLTLVRSMLSHGVRNIVFSSSASVYADPVGGFSVCEDDSLSTGSPYAETKRMMERVLVDIADTSTLRPVILRYFNPIGSDPQLRTGQQRQFPTHVLGMMLQAWQSHSTFTITGCDWDTPDGTGIRDYIHVWDLARAHIAAVERFDTLFEAGERHQIINVGTGAPVSVRELAEAFQSATGEPLTIEEGPRRPGDVIGAYASTDKAHKLLDWKAELSVTDGIADAIRWLPERKRILGY